METPSHCLELHRVTILSPIRRADTGERPVLCRCDDGYEYWCKSFEPGINEDRAVNEIVSAEVGRVIGAPVCEWAVIEPGEFAGELIQGNVISDLPLFGSRVVQTAQEKDTLDYLNHDGNQERIPRLVALWYLCNAVDIQVLYKHENDFQIFSFDHGYWFDSQEPPGRQLISFHQPAGRPEIPAIPGHIKKDNWQAAINAVDALEYSDLHHITDMIPPEWNQSKQGMDEILHYVLGRQDYTIERLTHHMNQTSR